MGNKAQAQKSSETAKRMKERGIRRTTTICPVCYRTVRVPFDPRTHNCS